jgi:hypothetical protein
LKRIFVASLAIHLLSLGCAAAEPTALEQRIREATQQHPEYSVLFMDVRVLKEGKDPICTEISVSVVSDEGYSGSFSTRRSSGFFTGLDYGGVAFLRPGTYTIVSVTCKTVSRLNGKFARFRVGRNEIINTGCLVIDFTKGPITLFAPPTFTGRTSVEDLGAKAIASMTERTPSIFPKATNRYMTPNPATSGKRPS